MTSRRVIPEKIFSTKTGSSLKGKSSLKKSGTCLLVFADLERTLIKFNDHHALILSTARQHDSSILGVKSVKGIFKDRGNSHGHFIFKASQSQTCDSTLNIMLS